MGILMFFGTGYALLVPVFQAPDEPAHFARAYGVAEGQFVLRDHPRALADLMYRSADAYYDAENFLVFRHVREMLENSRDRVPNVAYNSSQYSFAAYLPHAAIIKLVMVFVDHPGDMLISLYAGRILTVLLYCAAIGWAMVMVPWAAWLVFWVGITPMALSQAAVFSTDVLVFCSGLVLLCIAVSPLKLYIYATLAICSVFVLLVIKPPYVFLVLVPLAGAVLTRRHRWQKTAVLVLGTGLAVWAGFIWKNMVDAHDIYAFTMERINYYRSGDIQPAAQLRHILDHPLQFAGVLGNTLVQHGFTLVRQFVGVLGWHDLPLPIVTVAVWLGLAPAAFYHGLCTLPVTHTTRAQKPGGETPYSQSEASFALSPKETDILGGMQGGDTGVLAAKRGFGVVWIAAGVLTILSILAVLYLTWMPVGAQTIEAQGRYFHIPVLAVLLGLAIVFAKKNRICMKKPVYMVLLAGSAVINGIALVSVIQRYYMP